MILKKTDLLDSKTQNPLTMRNKALLSLDGGGLRGLLTGARCAAFSHESNDAQIIALSKPWRQ